MPRLALFTLVAPLALMPFLNARADAITYKVSTTDSYLGDISGTLSGTGDTITAFNLEAESSKGTYLFDSDTRLGGSGFTWSTDATLEGQPVYEFQFVSGTDRYLDFYVLGTFESGLTYVHGPRDMEGRPGTLLISPIASVYQRGGEQILVSDDLSLTREASAVTSEPFSLALVATGILALLGLRLRPSIHPAVRS